VFFGNLSGCFGQFGGGSHIRRHIYQIAGQVNAGCYGLAGFGTVFNCLNLGIIEFNDCQAFDTVFVFLRFFFVGIELVEG
jgi:hypothetical protein